MSDQVSKPLSDGMRIFKSLFWDTTQEAEVSALFAAQPLLAVWPLGPVIRSLLKIFSDRLFSRIQLGIDLAAVPFINSEHADSYRKAEITLKIIAHTRGWDSQEFKNANQIAKDAQSKFTRYNV